MQSDLNQALSEKDAAEQEVLTGKLAAERSERQARQEQNRSQSEINSYKQRLERADADLMHCRRENLRLSEQIASLEKEVNNIIISKSNAMYGIVSSNVFISRIECRQVMRNTNKTSLLYEIMQIKQVL